MPMLSDVPTGQESVVSKRAYIFCHLENDTFCFVIVFAHMFHLPASLCCANQYLVNSDKCWFLQKTNQSTPAFLQPLSTAFFHHTQIDSFLLIIQDNL